MVPQEFAPETPAEEKLLAEAGQGGRIVIGDGAFPGDDPARVIRAEAIRRALTGQDPALRLSDKGLRLKGARIAGVIDLQGAETVHDLALTACHLDSMPEMVNARLRGVYFTNCHLPGLSADNAVFDGALYLRGGTLVTGEISLAGARITGDLQLCDVELHGTGQDAVFAPSLRVGGSVYLGNYPYSGGVTELSAEGAIFLATAQVGNDVFVTRCAIAPREAAGESVFHASEEHGPDNALSLARARIGGILYFRENQIARGIVSLAGAHAARLRDEPAGPGATYPIRLDGFTYDDFSRHTETSLSARLKWLGRQPKDTGFTAQPWEQLARVLHHMGHRHDARTVRMRKEQILRRENRRMLRARAAEPGLSRRTGRAFRWWISLLTDVVMHYAVGYGYRPGRALLLAVLLIAGLGVFFQRTWAAGDMAPNAAPILVSAGWQAAVASHPGNPAAFWSAPGQAGQDYETFHAYAYAADLVIPLVSLGQEAAWAPSTSRSPWGRAGWWLRWIAVAAGWVITALGAAAVTGAVRQE